MPPSLPLSVRRTTLRHFPFWITAPCRRELLLADVCFFSASCDLCPVPKSCAASPALRGWRSSPSSVSPARAKGFVPAAPLLLIRKTPKLPRLGQRRLIQPPAPTHAATRVCCLLTFSFPFLALLASSSLSAFRDLYSLLLSLHLLLSLAHLLFLSTFPASPTWLRST